MEEVNIINTSEFEDLFAKTTAQTKRKPLSEAYEKKAKARKVIIASVCVQTHSRLPDYQQDLSVYLIKNGFAGILSGFGVGLLGCWVN